MSSLGSRTANLFIVGAPKCGTTSLYSWLGDHPDIYFPARKELNFFGSDLPYRYSCDLIDYESNFAGARCERYRGDASVFYLFSQAAAQEIHRYCPDARIVAMVRNPVDAMHSLYYQLSVAGAETAASFREALKLQDDRRAGAGVPSHAMHPYGLQYQDIMHFAPQIKRYREVFGESRVHVIVQDDMVRDPAAVYGATLDFLGLPAGDRTDFPTRNQTTGVRSPAFRDLVLNRPGAFLQRTDTGVFTRPGRFAERVIRRLNTKSITKPPMDADLRSELVAQCRPGLRELEDVLGRDLSAWYQTDRAACSPPKRPLSRLPSSTESVGTPEVDEFVASPTHEPRVSVVITSYQTPPDLLTYSLQSALDQSLGDLEVVLVLDGPPLRGGEAVVDRYESDPRVQVVRPGRVGRGRALNTGIRCSSAPFIAIQDADDESHSERLKRQLLAIEKRPDIAVLATDVRRTRSLSDHATWPAGVGSATVSELDRELVFRNPIVHSSVLIRRDALDRVGGYSMGLHRHLDYDLYLQIRRAGGVIAVLPEVLVLKRHHHDQNFEVETSITDRVWCAYKLQMAHSWHQYGLRGLGYSCVVSARQGAHLARSLLSGRSRR